LVPITTKALKDEAGSVKALGMDYIYIPVKFETRAQLTSANFARH
jgi:protein tyrosine phosphatase (PTP) superfamily phosphohydrolase (DUF442 family)